MTIQFYDTPSRAKRIFEPLEPGKVRMYSCGPTVWDYSHIGNFRCFLFYDVLKRYLQYRGFEVEHVMNLTDVDDRIVQKVNDGGTTLDAYVQTYIDGFHEDIDALGDRLSSRFTTMSASGRRHPIAFTTNGAGPATPALPAGTPRVGVKVPIGART